MFFQRKKNEGELFGYRIAFRNLQKMALHKCEFILKTIQEFVSLIKIRLP